MKRLDWNHVWALIALSVILWGVSPGAYSAEPALRVGQTLNHILSVCIEKSDAIEIVKTEAADGMEKALAMWESKDRCAPVPVQCALVGKAVFEASVERNGRKMKMRVIEILNPDTKRVVAYFFSTLPYEAIPVGDRGA